MSLVGYIRKMNATLNASRPISEDAIDFIFDIAFDIIIYFNDQVRKYDQEPNADLLKTIIRDPREDNPFSGDITKYSLRVASRHMHAVFVEGQNTDVMAALQQLEIFRHYNRYTGAYLAGVVMYIIDELIDMASGANIDVARLQNLFETDAELKRFSLIRKLN
jgi:hypothetical protein